MWNPGDARNRPSDAPLIEKTSRNIVLALQLVSFRASKELRPVPETFLTT